MMQQHFELSQPITTTATINGAPRTTTQGELLLAGVGYHHPQDDDYTYDMEGIYYYPCINGSYLTNNINILPLLTHLGISPADDDQLHIPIVSHLQWLFSREGSAALSHHRHTEAQQGIAEHFAPADSQAASPLTLPAAFSTILRSFGHQP